MHEITFSNDLGKIMATIKGSNYENVQHFFCIFRTNTKRFSVIFISNVLQCAPHLGRFVLFIRTIFDYLICEF